MTIIELGGPDSAPAQSAFSARRRDQRAVDKVAAAVSVAFICAATLTGSIRPPSNLVQPSWSSLISRNSVIVAEPGTVLALSPEAETRVTAYDLDSGSMRWSKVVAVSRPSLTAEPSAVMLPIGPATVRFVDAAGIPVVRAVPQATVALDVRTGGERWRLPGEVQYATPETALLAESRETVRQVRISDGTVLWSHTVAGAKSWKVASHEQQSPRIVAAATDGRVEIFRLADGAWLAGGRLRVGRAGLTDEVIGVDAGVMYLSETVQGKATVTAYDLASLHRRWQYAQRTGDPQATRAEALPCDGVMCFRDATTTVGLDPDTGASRWLVPGLTAATAVRGESRLLVEATDDWHGLIDTTTGGLVAEFGLGRVVWDFPHTRPIYFVQNLSSADGRVAVSRIDPHTGRLRVRALIPGIIVRSCGALNDRLVCGTYDDRLAVTTVG